MFHVSCFVVHGLWLRNQEPPNLPPTKLGLRIWDDPRNTLKSHQISCQIRMQLSQENWSQATKIMKNRRWHRCKSWFLLIHPLPKYLVFQSQTSRFRSQSHQGEQPGNNYEKIDLCYSKGTQKLQRWIPWINQHSIKTKPVSQIVLFCASRCPRIVQGSAEGSPRRQSRGTKPAMSKLDEGNIHTQTSFRLDKTKRLS